MNEFIRPGLMLKALLHVAGIATAAALSFSNYEHDNKNYIRVDDADSPLQCRKDSPLTVQYNLGSILVPGVSPLAYENGTWNNPAAAVPGQALPEWWAINQEPAGRAAYRLRNEEDSLLATGLFIPEVEPLGDFWSSTNPDREDDNVKSNRANFNLPPACVVGKRPTEEELQNNPTLGVADLDEMQKFLADLGATGSYFEYDTRALIYTDVACADTDFKEFAPIGNLTGYKYVSWHLSTLPFTTNPAQVRPHRCGQSPQKCGCKCKGGRGAEQAAAGHGGG